MTEERGGTAVQTVLLVEDEAAHAELVIRVFGEHDIENQVIHVPDGEAALDYLFRRGAFADPASSPRPTVVLLDLRLPKIDGLDVLAEIRQVPDLDTVPVAIFSTSAAERDVQRAYAERANSYLVKPIDFGLFTDLIRGVGDYWLRWNHQQ